MVAMILLVVLQNAYDRGSLTAGWNPSRWRREYEASRTGKRLAKALPETGSIHYTNANPRMGNGPDSRHEPDLAHLRRRLHAIKPDAVLACGKLAEEAIADVWPGTLFVIPHPASRVLTNALLAECKLMIGWWYTFQRSPGVAQEYCRAAPVEYIRRVACDMPRFALRQRRGHTEVIEIP